ncbi:MAG: prenyltransferase [Methanocella sp. PtaU1.Bin125]|nr:MAG: prenyltransferase [Methanocella sp. PtaU1.Bin125]
MAYIKNETADINNINSILKWIKNEFIFGAHYLSLGYPALFLSLMILLDLQIDFFALIVTYLIPLIVYSFNYQKELDKDIITNPEKVKYLKNRERIFPYLMGLYILLLIGLLIFLNNHGFSLFILIILVGGLLYTIVFKVLTRTIPGFKSIYTAMVWAYAGTFCVSFFYSLQFSVFYLLYFTFLFLKGLINVIFFDIKDISSDKRDNLRTFPILLGVKKTIILLHILNILSLCILLYGVYTNILPIYTLALSIFFVYTLYYLTKGNTNDNQELHKYTYLMVDGECIFWPIVLVIFKFLYLKFF